ncbi:hypothetical protein HID58_041054 [Brassica napus]|uniref:BnaCnng47060D protein n=2 Tax=Brassica napus TaxID=3708 RepID=A0A078JCR9_BRANA|nr:hypothetical protein HID58_041054 [Brassica napus]CAF2069624.1 unnamed protein product [Brassica napus]CDY65428.1 BnaCnng47060D [Brassica napus]
MSRDGSESGNGDGNGRIGGMRFIPSIWQMEPDLSRCLYASPTFNVVATFHARPPATGYFSIRPAPLGRLIVPQITRLGGTGVFIPPIATQSQPGTGVFIPPIATPSQPGTGVFIPPIATTPSQSGTGVFIPPIATPSQSGTGAGR